MQPTLEDHIDLMAEVNRGPQDFTNRRTVRTHIDVTSTDKSTVVVNTNGNKKS